MSGKFLLWQISFLNTGLLTFNLNMLSCRGNTPETRGTAYVVYEDIFDAKNACDHLSGFNVCNRYLVVLYYNANRASIFLKHVNSLILLSFFPFDENIMGTLNFFSDIQTREVLAVANWRIWLEKWDGVLYIFVYSPIYKEK